MNLGSLFNIDFKKSGTTVGVGYIFRTRRVFFTLNGKEVYQMGLPEGMLDIKFLYPTFSLSELKDRIQINFGQGKTSFRFDLQSKIKVSHFIVCLTLAWLTIRSSQMYYKNIFEDIVSSDFGEVSSIFEKDPQTVLTLAKDYLYSQGYFNTLACIHDGFKTEIAESIAGQASILSSHPKLKEASSYATPKKTTALDAEMIKKEDKTQVDERENRFALTHPKANGSSNEKETRVARLTSTQLIERDLMPI